jgi:hypothetical protein
MPTLFLELTRSEAGAICDGNEMANPVFPQKIVALSEAILSCGLPKIITPALPMVGRNG